MDWESHPQLASIKRIREGFAHCELGCFVGFPSENDQQLGLFFGGLCILVNCQIPFLDFLGDTLLGRTKILLRKSEQNRQNYFCTMEQALAKKYYGILDKSTSWGCWASPHIPVGHWSLIRGIACLKQVIPITITYRDKE